MSPALSFDTEGNEYLHMFQHDFKSMLSEGTHITIGSDWSHGIPLSMFDNVAVLVNTIGAEKILEIITLAGAIATGREQVRNLLFARDEIIKADRFE
jgi:predicted amidohydrolase YtcJ